MKLGTKKVIAFLCVLLMAVANSRAPVATESRSLRVVLAWDASPSPGDRSIIFYGIKGQPLSNRVVLPVSYRQTAIFGLRPLTTYQFVIVSGWGDQKTSHPSNVAEYQTGILAR